MTFDVNLSIVPDHDTDQVLPATYRNTAPWDSGFAVGADASVKVAPRVGQDLRAANPDAWMSAILMRLYND